MQVAPNPGNRFNRNGNSAYTLIEVLCSLAIAAIVAAVLFVGFDNGFAILRTTREDLRATQILMQKTEAFRLFTWQQLSNNAPRSFTNYYNPAGAATNGGGTVFIGIVNPIGPATNLPNSVAYRDSLHLITISVAWTNYVGSNAIPHFRQMQTLSAKAGMQNYLAR